LTWRNSGSRSPWSRSVPQLGDRIGPVTGRHPAGVRHRRGAGPRVGTPRGPRSSTLACAVAFAAISGALPTIDEPSRRGRSATACRTDWVRTGGPAGPLAGLRGRLGGHRGGRAGVPLRGRRQQWWRRRRWSGRRGRGPRGVLLVLLVTCQTPCP
jgi:hypothetical protein